MRALTRGRHRRIALRNPDAPRLAQPGEVTGDVYLDMLEASNRRISPTRRAADDITHHRNTRPCVLCDIPMVGGACPDHGRPAEDDGSWLWTRGDQR